MNVNPLVLAGLLAMLAGCDSGRDAAPLAVESAPQADAAAAPLPPCLEGTGYDLLPAEVCLRTPFAHRATRTYQDKEGRDRTRVTFDYEGSADDVVASISTAFSGAGYRGRDREHKDDGRLLVPFTKSGAGTTYLEIKPLPEGGGSFFIDYRNAQPVEATTPAT